MTRRLPLAVVLAAPLISSAVFAAPRAPLAKADSPAWAPAAPADPQCGGPNKPDEGPKPPKEPPKT